MSVITSFRKHRLAPAVATATLGIWACAPATATAAAATTCPQRLTAAEKAVALNDIANLMGRYSHLAVLRGRNTLGELFALNTPGVSWRTPAGPQGIDGVKRRLAGESGLIPGQLHAHAMFTPVIEVAADGQTAKGVWDSFGPNVNGLDEVGGWSWVKYGVDFVKENGTWKIWHMQLYPIFNTPYDRSITQSAWDRAHPNRPGNAPERATTAHPDWTGPKNPWLYDGNSVVRGPKVPEPYCSFDPKDSYGNVDSD